VVGLEPSVAVLHEFADYQTRQWLVYDLQEPFRWIADVTVMEAFEYRVLDLPDFYFTGDNYRYHFEMGAKRRFLDFLRQRFNAGTDYNGRKLGWDTVIEKKTIELGRFLIGRSCNINFSDPSPTLIRSDDRELRKQILSLSQSDAWKLGIRKNTFHYLRKNARGERAFKISKKVRIRLEC